MDREAWQMTSASIFALIGLWIIFYVDSSISWVTLRWWTLPLLVTSLLGEILIVFFGIFFVDIWRSVRRKWMIRSNRDED